jgi:hypothetical protein
MRDRIVVLHPLVVANRNQLPSVGQGGTNRNAAFRATFPRLCDSRLHELINRLAAHSPILLRSSA